MENDSSTSVANLPKAPLAQLTVDPDEVEPATPPPPTTTDGAEGEDARAEGEMKVAVADVIAINRKLRRAVKERDAERANLR